MAMYKKKGERKMNLENLTLEELIELRSKVLAEIASRQETELVVYTHNCKNSAKHHRGKYKHWAKLLTEVDTTKTNGYAFKGDWLQITAEHKIPVGSIVVEVCDKDIVAYRITTEGKVKIAEAKTNSMSELIDKVALLV